MHIWTWALFSAVAVGAVSFFGRLLPIRRSTLERVGPYLLCLTAGLMLAESLGDLGPKMLAAGTPWWPAILGAAVVSLIRIGLHLHHRGHGTHAGAVVLPMLVADATHSTLDGLLIAASYLLNVSAGLAMTVAVMLHELPQKTGDYAVLLAAGMTRRQALLLNGLAALPVLIGSAVGLTVARDASTVEAVTGFAAGAFCATGIILLRMGRRLRPQAHLWRFAACALAGAALSIGLDASGIL